MLRMLLISSCCDSELPERMALVAIAIYRYFAINNCNARGQILQLLEFDQSGVIGGNTVFDKINFHLGKKLFHFAAE